MKRHFISHLLISAAIVCLLFVSMVSLNKKPESEAILAQKSCPIARGTLILDAGHGGEDGGAVSVTGTYESKINLSIANKAEQIAAFYGIKPIMTRSSDAIDYPENATTIRARKVADQKARVELINSVENAVLISIHQNKYTTAIPRGGQVFFAATAGSEDLANALQELIISFTESGNRKNASKIADSIYLMNSINCPAVLVECGFLSNDAEARLLEQDDYQTKLASIITAGYINSYLGT